MSEPNTPAPVARVAELASKLSALDPAAKDIVRDLFVAFTGVHTHYSRPQPIETAPHVPEASLLLFCPEQAGWQVGEWWTVYRPRWVATIDASIKLEPTLWMRPLEEPEA